MKDRKTTDSSSALTIIKTVVLTAGAIYLISLVTWFFHWATIFAGMVGVGFLVYQAANALRGSERSVAKQLTRERSYEAELRRLEAEERLLDSKIGL